MDLTTMKSRLAVESDIKQFNGPGWFDNKVMAGILLDIRDLLFVMNERQELADRKAGNEMVEIDQASVNLTAKQNDNQAEKKTEPLDSEKFI